MAIGSSSRFPRGAKGKFFKTSFGTICRVIFGHPFLLLTLLYLIILHRYFLFLFSLLVSVAPVLICTTLVLGTLLFYGEKQDHRVGNREERNNATESSNNGVVDGTYSAAKDGSFSEERFGEIRNDNEVTVSRGFQRGDFDAQDSQRLELRASNYDKVISVQYNTIMQDRSVSTFSSDRKKKRDISVDYDSSYSEFDGVEKSSLDAMVSEVIPTPQETHPLIGSEDPRHLQTTAHMSEVQSLESTSSSESSEDDEKDENVDDETQKAADGNNPSPFAWTENDQRILHELRSSEMEKNEHLESLISRDEDDGSEEMADEDEDDDDEESIDGIDDDVDEEEEEGEDGNLDTEKDGSNQVTLWTEEDEKNLRHLGCSELERNLRLENLLARRRAKRNFSMISERNLIDLDKFVLPFPVTPISTTRINPFDNHDDTTHHPSVPPIPGSAPSVSVPRKNPFDSPCTSPKKTSNLGVEVNLNKAAFHEGGSSSSGNNAVKHVPKPESVDKNRKEALFRRYESFSAGFNMMEDTSTHDSMEFDRRDFVLRRHETFNTRTPFPSIFSPNKPVFVAEHVARDVWHPSLSRQLSQNTESAESATSSDTETSTAPHPDDEAPYEGDHTSSHVETGSESSEAINTQFDDQDERSVRTTVMNVDHAYQEQEVLHVGHDNHDATSSSSLSSEHDVENSQNERDAHLVGSIEMNVDHADHQEIFHEGLDNHDDASSSSSSEHHIESFGNQSQIEHEQVEVPVFSPKDSSDMSEAPHMSTDDEHHPVEPVYDTSPSAAEKITAFTNVTQV